MPVTTAERSPIVFSLFIALRLKNSNKTQNTTLVKVTRSVLTPKRTTDSTSAGISAITTSSIIPLVVSTVRLCGEAVTVSFLSSLISAPPL